MENENNIDLETIVNMSDEDFLERFNAPPKEEQEEAALSDEQLPNTTGDEVSLTIEEDKSTEEKVTETTTDQEEKVETEDKEEVNTDTIDYKAEYEKIYSPFKANGVDMTVKDADEVITLMQKGANYHKKMNELRPNTKYIKMLENNNLLDEEALNRLIDLHKKDPIAVTNLIKEANIDPLEIDTSTADNYKANDYSVTDNEVYVKEVFDDINSTEPGRQVISDISMWDDQSKVTFLEQPDVMRELAEHKNSGIYDAVLQEVNRQSILGTVGNQPKLVTYGQTFNKMQSAGMFDKPTTPVSTNQVPPRQVVDVKTNTNKPVVSGNEQIKAISPIQSQPKKIVQETHPASMSDAQFQAYWNNKYN